jgi:hypothetical protein
MAAENRILDLSFVADEDLSANQFQFVVQDATSGNVRRPNNATERPVGILQNSPVAGAAASVRVAGVSKLQVNAALAAGQIVQPEYVTATDAGEGQALTNGIASGVLIDASGADEDLASCLIFQVYPAFTSAKVRTVVTDSTSGPRTFTGAEIFGGMILRDPNGAVRSDVMPTAADIVANIPACVVGSSFEFVIRNSGATYTITITTEGADVTLSGTMTIATANSKRFLAVVTNIGAGTEAATIYSLGTSIH